MNIENIFLGIAIGDAFGAGVEFQDRSWIRANVDYTRFVNARNQINVSEDKKEMFTKNYQPWDYTDDTEMTLGLIKALVSGDEFSEQLLIEKWKAEYDLGIAKKGFGRNGHGSMSWFYSGEKTINEIRSFQKNRKNPGNAPAMRSVPLGLLKSDMINKYCEINANATHPNKNAIISSQCIARATEFMLAKNGNQNEVVQYCFETVDLNQEYIDYFNEIETLPTYENLEESDFNILCGNQPIEKPYFLSGICGVPSDSKYTAGCVLYVLKNSKNVMDALVKSINIGGDVDSIASITTGIMAGRYNLDSLPDFMLQNLEGVDYIKEVTNSFEKYITNIL
ncbi:ADP-ribosylglycohydrolase family protein [uncultured Aquimarina sp.]|uniref:ADP-ribosylglycohydrolase family protein n=1 Tax=uncultured Aquimarina sp. TaxID=575652 RepID=UPI0026095FCC|nr:ADP-ribosylglycohydrolase family protein [uncultured Aquimarina sp.]